MDEGNRGAVQTYVHGLDARIEGGIPVGHIVLVAGETGSMKSSMAWNILYNNAKEGQFRGIYISLEQNKASILRHVSKLGQPIEDVGDKVAIIDLGWLRRELRDVDKTGEINWFEALLFQIRKYRENVHYDLLALDSLQALYVVSGMDNPREQLFHFFAALRDMGLTSFLITEMPVGKRQFGSFGVEEFLADGIIHMAMEREERTVGRYISVIKMREVRHATDYFPLIVDRTGFKIVTR